MSENIASQLRIVRPIAVDRTEVVTYCIGAKGESAAARRQRLRDYEEFFNPSGTATPDDLVSYQDCQAGFAARDVEWHHYARGMGVLQKGRNEHADELEIDVERWLYGGFSLGDETAHQSGFREWRRLLQRGLGSESSR
jgi:phenylpropionate dioxygenase-like ring-hydroxylating dioxygenase large terminal subunit